MWIFIVALSVLVLSGFSLEFRRALGKKRGWKCERCGRTYRDGWLMEVHHIVPSSLGGKDTEENARILCQGCHAVAHRKIEAQAKASAKLIEQRLAKTGGRR